MHKPRLHIPAASYHVALRGNYRRDIFFTRDDRELLDTIAGATSMRVRHQQQALAAFTVGTLQRE